MRMHSAVLFFAAAALMISCVAVTPAAAEGTKRLLDCTLESATLDECDPIAYGIRAGVYAVPGILLGLITLFTCPFFFCSRFICGCCGGSTASSGCCCASSQPALYGTMDIVRPKVYALLLILLGVGVGIWGNLSSDQTVKGLLGFVDDLEGTPQRLLDQINSIQAELIVTKYDPSTDSTYQEDLFNGTSTKADAEKVKADIEATLKDNADLFRKYVLDFGFVMFIIFCLPIGAVVLGGAAAVCNCRSCIPMLTVFLMFFVGTLLWLGHGIFSSFALVFGDVCSEVHGISRDQLNVLSAATSCNDTTMGSFTDNFQGIQNSAAREACGLVAALCYDNSRSTANNIQTGTVFNCNTPPDCNVVRFGELVLYIEETLVTDSRVDAFPGSQTSGGTCTDLSVPCTAARCSQLCRDPAGTRTASGKNTMNMYTSFKAAAKVSNALDTLGGQFGSCNALYSLLLSPFDGSCQDIAGGTLGLRQSSGLAGVMIIGFIFVMAWGSKRFVSLPGKDDDNEENHEIQLGDSSFNEKSPRSSPKNASNPLQDPGVVPKSD